MKNTENTRPGLSDESTNTPRRFFIDTPVGKLVVYAKQDEDQPENYPGVYVDIEKDGENVMLACVEYDYNSEDIVGTFYTDESSDEPTSIEHFEFTHECALPARPLTCGTKLWDKMPKLNVQKRFRDENGKATKTFKELAEQTSAEAAEYYQDSELYVISGIIYRYDAAKSLFAATEAECKEVSVGPASIGTFLPDVASDGMEIIALNDPCNGIFFPDCFLRISIEELENAARKELWTKAVIVFTQDSFSKEYSEVERAYIVSSSSCHFNPGTISNELTGSSLSGGDLGVRLDCYMYAKNGWKVDYCYIVEPNVIGKPGAVQEEASK